VAVKIVLFVELNLTIIIQTGSISKILTDNRTMAEVSLTLD
jgi:hypothetical protein